MPLPKPNKDEEHDDWIKRCMGNDTMNEEYPKNDQRYAVCENLWKDKKDMKIADIFLYGDIFNEQGNVASEWGIVSLSTVVKSVLANPDAEKLIIHIHSRGGDVNEGFAIHDYLVNSGKEIETIVEGMCFSIATVVFMAGTVRKMTENSEFMIHNPIGGALGDAEEMQKYVDRLKELEDKIIDFYSDKTGTERDKIKDLVSKETFLNVDEAIELGFATEKVEHLKAVAFFNPNIKHNTMKEEQQKEAITMLDKLCIKVKSIFGIDTTTTVKALELEAVDGSKLVIDTESTSPKVGDRITADGKVVAEEFSYELPTGEVITAKGGVITLVTLPVDKGNEELTALKAKVDEQDKTIKDLNDKIQLRENDYKEILAQMEALGKTLKSDFLPPTDTDRTRPPKDLNQNQNPVAEALRRRKESQEAK